MTTQIEQISAKFVERIQAALSDADLTEIDRRNREEPEVDGISICATHDFCDANEPMAEAFEEIMGREVDPCSDEDCKIWGAAWNHAKQNGFAR